MLKVKRIGYMMEVNKPTKASNQSAAYPLLITASKVSTMAPEAEKNNTFEGTSLLSTKDPAILPNSTSAMKTVMYKADFCSVKPGRFMDLA